MPNSGLSVLVYLCVVLDVICYYADPQFSLDASVAGTRDADSLFTNRSRSSVARRVQSV
jgi:hypothetical protein